MLFDTFTESLSELSVVVLEGMFAGFERLASGMTRVSPCAHIVVSFYANSILAVSITTFTMRKGIRKAKEKAGRLISRVRSASRSKSSAPPETDRIPVTPGCSSSKAMADTGFEPLQTADSQLPARSDLVCGVSSIPSDPDEIPPPPVISSHINSNTQAAPAFTGPDFQQLTEIAHLVSNTSLGHMPASIRAHNILAIVLKSVQTVFNYNQNTTYSFGGGDVFNNNTITNNIYLNRVEVRALFQIGCVTAIFRFCITE